MKKVAQAEKIVHKNWAFLYVFKKRIPQCEAVNLHATVPADRRTYSCALAKFCDVLECELKVTQN